MSAVNFMTEWDMEALQLYKCTWVRSAQLMVNSVTVQCQVHVCCQCLSTLAINSLWSMHHLLLSSHVTKLLSHRTPEAFPRPGKQNPFHRDPVD